MTTPYQQQVRAADDQIDLDFWTHPEGVSIPHDPLRFLYLPDNVESFIITQMARKVYHYQTQHVESDDQIAKGVMITMGGLLPGVLLHDHLAWRLNPDILTIEFGTLGVKFYKGPGQPLDEPHVVQDLTIDVAGQVVGVVDDLVDLGGTAKFVAHYLREKQAQQVILIAPYLKSTGIMDEMPVIYFGHVPKDTWIITPREKVETLIKRVPYWREQGATLADCAAHLKTIGYPQYLIDIYLRPAYERG